MTDAGPRAHHLHVARLGSAFVSKVVLVRDRTLAHIGDDLHVGMGMRWKARVGRDLVVVPNAQGAPAHARRIMVIAERKVVLGLQPAMVRTGELIEGSTFDHRKSSVAVLCVFGKGRMDTAVN